MKTNVHLLKLLFILLIIITIFEKEARAVNTPFDSKGKDFWLTFIPNYHNVPGPLSKDSLYIFITSEVPTGGVITYRDSAKTVTQGFSISDPKQVYIYKVSFHSFELSGILGINDTIPIWERNHSEKVVLQSFHIVSNDDITVYALNQADKTSDAFIVLPTDVLGNDYLIMSYNSNDSISLGTGKTPSQFAIVAKEDSTIVQIKPSAPTMYNDLKVQNITLDSGEVYLVQAKIDDSISHNYDLTGTTIHSSKPIAVFSGHQRATVPIDGGGVSRDCLIKEMPPLNTWGKNSFLTPFSPSPDEDSPGTDLFRIMAGYDSTNISIDGIKTVSLNKGEMYENRLIQPHVVTASNPILVAQFKKTAAKDSSRFGDPFMLIIPPKEQFITSCRIINAQAWQSDTTIYKYQYLSIIAPTSSLSSIKVDNNPVNTANFLPINSSGYSYANLSVSDGVHTVAGNDKMEVYIYGYGLADSYGYVGGMSFQPFDFNPPQIFTWDECFKMHGIALDTNEADSKIKSLTSPANTWDNVVVQIDSFTPLADSVKFSASLVDTTKDGHFHIIATDSAGFVTDIDIFIAGFTIGVNGYENVQLVMYSYVYTLHKDTTYCLKIPIHNYGKYIQFISNILHSSLPEFTHQFNNHFFSNPNEIDTITVCFKASKIGTYIDTLSIVEICGKKEFVEIIIIVKDTSNCDITEFNYPDFKDPQGLTLNGYSRIYHNNLQLTGSRINEDASVWHSTQVPVKKGFSTEFAFRISDGGNNSTKDPSYPGGDGIAFVIQNSSLSAMGNNGGGIGYQGISNSLAIEYDLFCDDSTQIINLNDPNGNHIAVQSRGTAPNSPVHNDSTTLGMAKDIMIIKGDGTVYFSKIDYNVIPGQLRIFIDTTGKFLSPALVVDSLDISTLLSLKDGDKAWCGFTAGTGGSYETQEILKWSMCPKGEGLPNGVNYIENNVELSIKVIPNPVYSDAIIEINNPSNGNVELDVYNILGIKIKGIYSGMLENGMKTFNWLPEGLVDGLYYLKFKTPQKEVVVPVIIMK